MGSVGWVYVRLITQLSVCHWPLAFSVTKVRFSIRYLYFGFALLRSPDWSSQSVELEFILPFQPTPIWERSGVRSVCAGWSARGGRCAPGPSRRRPRRPRHTSSGGHHPRFPGCGSAALLRNHLSWGQPPTEETKPGCLNWSATLQSSIKTRILKPCV